MGKFINLKSLIWPTVALIIAFSAFYLKPWQTKVSETISLNATGKAEVTPNIAQIIATISSNNPNLDQARTENTQKVSTLVGKLRDLGIDKKDIKTINLNAGQYYQPQLMINQPAPPNRSQTSTSLQITIRNFDKSDAVIATLTQNGVTNFYGPNLTVDDQTLENAKGQARQNAVENAKTQADQLAQAANRKLGKVTNIKEAGDFALPVPLVAQNSADLKAKANQIQPGQNEVSITLQVDFSLK